MAQEPKFCPQCGAALVQRPAGDRLRPTCAACGFIYYLNPVVAAAALVEEDGRVVLVRRGSRPKAGYWGLPAGYVEADETADEAAVRETREEAGLEIAVDELLDVYSFGGEDFPRGVLIVYSGHTVGGELRAGDDATEAALFAPDELPSDADIAFWTHRRALRDWRRARAVSYLVASDQDAAAAAALAVAHSRPLHEARPADRCAPGHSLLVARDRGEIVGYAGLTLTGDDVARLAYLFVAPSYRRWGIGTHLIGEAVALAARSGMRSVVAEVEAGNPAVAVYLKAGFRVCGFANAPAARHGETALLVACVL